MTQIESKRIFRTGLLGALGVLLVGAPLTSAQTTFTQATVGVYAPGANTVDKSATASPNDVDSFTTAVGTAFEANMGGVFNFGTPFANGTTVLQGTFGSAGTKRVDITSSQGLQTVANNGSFTQISDPVGIAQNADSPGFTLTLSSVMNATTGEVIPTEGVTRVGFTLLSRTHATYPADIRVTATYGDGSMEVVTTPVGNPKGEDDTFVGFTAPAGKVIQSLDFRSFATGTEDAVNTRIALDDFGFIVSAAAPPPSIENVVPGDFAIHKAEDGLSFEIVAGEPVAPGGISLTLNGTDVTGQLQIGGEETHRIVTFSGLTPDTDYTAEIRVTNDSGTTTLTRTFYTATAPFTLYDSEGFTSDELYPLGLLQPVTHGRATWEPHVSEPAEVVQAEEPQGKVLQKLNVAASRADWVHFPPISSGTIIIELDVWVSTTAGRTLDITLSPEGSALMAGFVAWGGVADKLAWYDNANWLPISDLQTGWHRYKIINYLSGPAAGHFDVLVDDVKVGSKLKWRNAEPGMPLGRLRFHSQDVNPPFEYAQVDNMVITAAPEDPNAFPPPQIVNFTPADNAVIQPSDGVRFEVTSDLAIAAGDITATLNGTDISNQLVVAGTENQRVVTFNALTAGRHVLEITARNSAGTTTLTRSFTAAEAPLTIFDSGGFESDLIYPEGFLQAIDNEGSIWAPAANPGEIVRLEDAHAKVLRRTQVGVDSNDILRFPAVSSGVLTIDFEARASLIDSRTLDMSLLHATGGNMASFVGWGTAPGSYSYYDAGQAAWIPMFEPGSEWHSYSIVNYLSGPNAGKFDLKVDGALVGEKLPFRHAFPEGTSVGQLRVGAIRGTVGEFGEVDNLVIKVEPLAVGPEGVAITGVAREGNTFKFSFASQAGFSHVVEYKENLQDATWTTLETIEGDGTIKNVTDQGPLAAQRFYRVRTE